MIEPIDMAPLRVVAAMMECRARSLSHVRRTNVGHAGAGGVCASRVLASIGGIGWHVVSG